MRKLHVVSLLTSKAWISPEDATEIHVAFLRENILVFLNEFGKFAKSC